MASYGMNGTALTTTASATDGARALTAAPVLSAAAVDALGSSMADSTRRSYAGAWSHFVAWCWTEGRDAFPAAPETVADYLANLAAGHKISTVRHRLTVINQAHEAKGADSPGKTLLVRAVVRGIARRKAGAGERVKKAEPVLTESLAGVVAKLAEVGTVEALRDKALLLVGYAGALRRGELGALTVDDLAFDAQGVKVAIRRSKTDQAGVGVTVGIYAGRNPATCPVRALRAWLEASGITEGPVFRGLRKGGRVTGKGLSGEAIRRIVSRRMTEGGDGSGGYSGHSLRRGFVSQGVSNGASERAMMKTTRHRSITVFRGYVKDYGAWADNEGQALGL